MSIDWVNPHVILHIETIDGLKRHWRILAATPNVMLRRGLNRSTVSRLGDISITFYREKNDECTANCEAFGHRLTDGFGRTIVLNPTLDSFLSRLTLNR